MQFDESSRPVLDKISQIFTDVEVGFHNGLETCWNTTGANEHGLPVSEDLGFFPLQGAF